MKTKTKDLLLKVAEIMGLDPNLSNYDIVKHMSINWAGFLKKAENSDLLLEDIYTLHSTATEYLKVHLDTSDLI